MWGMLHRANATGWRLPSIDATPNHGHSAEEPQGTVKVYNNGVVETKWKTALAAKYVPELVRAWSRLTEGSLDMVM